MSRPASPARPPAATEADGGRKPGCGWFVPTRSISSCASRESPETNRRGWSQQQNTGASTKRLEHQAESLRLAGGLGRACETRAPPRQPQSVRALRHPVPRRTFRSVIAQRSPRGGHQAKTARRSHVHAVSRGPKAALRCSCRRSAEAATRSQTASTATYAPRQRLFPSAVPLTHRGPRLYSDRLSRVAPEPSPS